MLTLYGTARHASGQLLRIMEERNAGICRYQTERDDVGEYYCRFSLSPPYSLEEEQRAGIIYWNNKKKEEVMTVHRSGE